MVLIGTFVALSFTITEALSMQVCGKALADMLDLVCDGRGFHWMQMDEGLPSIGKRTALQYLTKRSKSYSRGGVVQECCRKSCRISQLESYCASGPGTKHIFPTGGPMYPETARELMRSRVVSTVPPVTTTAGPRIVTERPNGKKFSPVTSTRFGKPPVFFYVRGVMTDRPTRSPFSRRQ